MAGRAHDARTATEARAGADVKHKLALASREIEQLDGTLGDDPLHLHVSRPLRVVACLHFIVVDLPRSCKVPAEARSVTHVSAGRGAHHSTHPAGRACDANTFSLHATYLWRCLVLWTAHGAPDSHTQVRRRAVLDNVNRRSSEGHTRAAGQSLSLYRLTHKLYFLPVTSWLLEGSSGRL